MANWITGREFLMAVKKATTWGTAVQVGADDGVLIRSEGIGGKEPTFADDDSLGQDEIMHTYKVAESRDGNFEGYLRYEGWEVILAMLLGTAGSPSGSAAYTHVIYPAANIDGKFVTLVMKKAGTTYGIQEIPSAKIYGFTITANIGEPVKISINVAGNKLETLNCTNDSNEVDAVTYPDRGNLVILDDSFRVRMNSQGGGALSDSDKIYPKGYTLTYNRPMDLDYQAGSICRVEPVQNGFSEVSLVLNFAKYDADTFFSAIESGTEYKMDIFHEGAEISAGGDCYSFRIDIPKIQWKIASANVSGPGKIPLSVTGRPFGVSSAPTGMAIATPIGLTIVNTRSTDPLT